MKLATKTLLAIDGAIEYDQGDRFRELLRPLIPKMEDAFRKTGNPFRSHLGASKIGKECARSLFYGFRWCTPRFSEGRMIRLFNRGHIEEARFIAMLQTIGCKVWYETEDGGQFKFSDHEEHFGSALDAVLQNVPDLPPEAYAYGEFKTHNKKQFAKLVKEGVQSAHEEHFIQCQVCMGKMQLPYSLYLAVCKDDDKLHAEIIEFDKEIYERYLARAGHIITDAEPGGRIGHSNSFNCKFCDDKPVCFGDVLPEINCRTCRQGFPGEAGQWICGLNQNEVNTSAKYTGCAGHIYNPRLLFGIKSYAWDQEAFALHIIFTNGGKITQGPYHTTSQQFKAEGYPAANETPDDHLATSHEVPDDDIPF